MFASSVPAAFDQAVALHSQRSAIICGGSTTTYLALSRQASTLASQLRRHGVGPGCLVGLFTPRASETVAAILGVLRAGAAYVPFDPSYPAVLLGFLAEDSGVKLVLVHASLLAQARSVFGSRSIVVIEDAIEAAADDPVDMPQVGLDDPAYVMYTSGSTGRPKGVVVPHRAVLRLVVDNTYAHFGPDEVFLQLAPLSFDASTFEIWGALLHGGTLVVEPALHPSLDAIASSIAQHAVTTLWLTAGLFHLMVEHRLDGLATLRQLLAGGDVLSPAHVRRAFEGLPGCRLINGYGPTENTTFSCCHTVRADDLHGGAIPIGHPIAHTQVHVLDATGAAVADGDEGELHVGGAGLALGYLRRPELSAERFIAHPAFGRLYRTGDRVRRRADGALMFVGRVDRQVKINGKRIELDEIEACIRRSGLVADAAVVVADAGPERRRIAAFVTGLQAPDGDAALRRFLRAQLPEHMVPGTIEVLDALPLSPTGKVDRARLPALSTATLALPHDDGTPLAVLRRIWCQVLRREDVAGGDGFFDLGGTSLDLIEVHAMLLEALGVQIDLAELFAAPTLDDLARRVAAADRSTASPLAPVQDISRAPSLPEYYHASVGSSALTMESAREVTIVLIGEGAVDPALWQAALARVAAVHPALRLRLLGRRRAARWHSDGQPPRLRLHEGASWDVRSEVGAGFIRAVPLSLADGPTVELIVAPQGERTLVVLRALHAVADGGGAMLCLRELFRSLRGEALEGSNAAFSDVDLMRSIGLGDGPAPARTETSWLTGSPQGSEVGDVLRRISIAAAGPQLLARSAVAMAELAHRFGGGPARIAVPMDLRLHDPALRSTANFSSMVFVSMHREDGVDVFRRQLQEQLAARAQTRYAAAPEWLKALPLPWLDLLVSRHRFNYRRARARETAVISDLGMHASAPFSGGGFRLREMVVLPLQGSVFTTLVGIDGRAEMMLNLPRVLASGGRLDAVLAHLQQRLGADT